MYLCEKDNKNDIINIYTLESKIRDLKRYKAAILLAGQREKLFYRFSTSEGFEITTARNGNSVKLDSKKNKLEVDYVKPSYPYSEKTLAQEWIIAKYMNNELNNATMLTISSKENKEQKTRDFLITTDAKVNEYNEDNFILDNLLNLPEELAIIHLIESNNVDELYKRVIFQKLNIDKQLELYKIKYINSVDFKEIEKLYNAGILPKEPFYECKKKISESTKILSLIKR